MAVVETFHVGKQHQQRRSQQVRDHRGEPVVVADPAFQFVDPHGVVFVDDRNGIVLERSQEGVPHVEISRAVVEVVGREQDLCRVPAMGLQCPVVGFDQPTLADGRYGLQMPQIAGSPPQPEPSDAGPHCPARDQHHLALIFD